MKAGLKDAVAPQVLFTDLGIKYLGPVDGHDEAALESALRRAKAFGGPVIVHAVTRKGMGYAPAENHVADQMHSTGVIDPLTGKATGSASADWTSVFSAELIDQASHRQDIVAITAAMAGPTGLAAFGEKYPDRMFDVGIAEQHAVTSAAGLALGGLHPVVAVYSTFLNRAFDQLLMDVALLKLPVTLVLDRAGITGTDGASHNGMWDMSLLGIVPGNAGRGSPRHRHAAGGTGRGAGGRRRSDRAPVPEGHGRRRRTRGEPLDGVVDILRPPPGGTTCSSCRSARSPVSRSPRRNAWNSRASRRLSSTRGGSCRSRSRW